MTVQELIQALRRCQGHAEGCDPACPMQANMAQCYPYILRLAAEKLEELSDRVDDRSELRARLQINAEDNDRLRRDNAQLADSIQRMQEERDCIRQRLQEAERLCERTRNAVHVAEKMASQVAKLTREVEGWKLLCQRRNRECDKAVRKKRMAEHVKKRAMEDMQLIRAEYSGECRTCRHLCRHADGRQCDTCPDSQNCICMGCDDKHDHWKWRGPDAEQQE